MAFVRYVFVISNYFYPKKWKIRALVQSFVYQGRKLFNVIGGDDITPIRRKYQGSLSITSLIDARTYSLNQGEFK